MLCAGAGLFHNSIIKDSLPVQLVRGQSIELALEKPFEQARLCGKYVSPLPESNRALIGATQEFKDEPLNPGEVEAELKKRTNAFLSDVWEAGTIQNITVGYRVQSNRGLRGRMPIIGRFDTPIHGNTWIFTGLSSRGLLYHAMYGEILSKMILNDDESESPIERRDLDWWQRND